MISILLETYGLKALDRAGWVRRGVSSPESVAAHSWGVAFLTLLLLPNDLNRERALVYAILHDLPEVRAGDVTPHDGVSRRDKVLREQAAMLSMGLRLPHGARWVEAWSAYEAQADPESRFVRQLDRLDMALQAVRYEHDGHGDLREFLDSARRVIQHPRLVALLDDLEALRQGADGQDAQDQAVE